MSFDHSAHRQQATSDPSQGLQPEQQQQQQQQQPELRMAAPPTPRATEERNRSSSSTNNDPLAYAGPSLPPPTQLASPIPYTTTSSHQADYARRNPYSAASSHPFPSGSSSQSWDYSERQGAFGENRPLPAQAVGTPQQQFPTPLRPSPREYPHATAASSLPLPVNLNANTPFQLHRPVPSPSSNTPYDPIRSMRTTEENNKTTAHIGPPPVPGLPPYVKQESSFMLSAQSAFQRHAAASPIMSISQLLSSDTSPRPQQQATKPSLGKDPNTIAGPSSSSSIPPYKSEPQEQQQRPISESQGASSTFRSGIKNLLNSDNEEVYQMADSDTDTEDIPLLQSSAAADAQISQQSLAGNSGTNGQHTTERPSSSSMVSPSNSSNAERKNGSPKGRDADDCVTLGIRRRYDLSDDSSEEEEIGDHEGRPTRIKSLTERTFEELGLSDDDDEDEEIYNTHREEMIQYMLDVHRRKQQIVEDYEKKRSQRHAMISDHLRRIYEKRYGPDILKEVNGFHDSPISATTALLLNAAKKDKEYSKRKLKRAKHRHYADDGLNEDDFDYGSQAVYRKGPKMSPRKLEEERRQLWLNIARKDIPRMARILTRVQATRAGNCKKVAQYCQKEAKRAATKSGRLNRDVQAKAKRAMKEMLVFWKRNEKEERELRKKAEKEALERLRLEEERREAQRQARKLNFLITQTELYSHFIGRKIKADTSEDDETAVAASDSSTPLPAETSSDVQIDDIDTSTGQQPLGEIDFDQDDEEKLREHARRSAQNALAKQRERTRAFDEGARERRLAASEASDMSMSAAQLDTMNFQDPSSMGTEEIKQPAMLMCQLKSYQLKGLNWLANLYEQGINGILADEMGLGKTVQSIALMAYLAEVHNIWGPFLVIAPASTLHNWQQEITKFVPSFRALPYWGNPKDRKVLRQFWNRKQLYGRDAPFHVVITSYQLVLTDVSYFQRVKWQYMVLDEAQAIKSSSSARWKQLLGFHCRNRLLLTGTPIQNSMQELWALLHFIMPTLFDSHEEFSEWFSKDIESHAENKGTLNEHQLKRLHMILKPFMLRRIKRNVQHELGEKIEVEIYCDLTARQRALYRGLKEKISISELLEKATSLNEESMDSLMNLVMQFRKVCNHPELFERADVVSPLSFCTFSETATLIKEPSLYCPYSSSNPIKYRIPKRLYRNGGILRVVGPESNAGFCTRYLDNLMNIWSPDYIHESMLSDEPDSAFSFLRFIDTSPQEASYIFKQSLIGRWIAHLAQRDKRSRRRVYSNSEDGSYPDAPINTFARFLITETVSSTYRLAVTPNGPMDELTSVGRNMEYVTKWFDQWYIPGARTVPIDAVCSDRSFTYDQNNILFDSSIRACLFGWPQHINSYTRHTAADLAVVTQKTTENQGIMPVPSSGHGYSMMRVPAMRDLILDSGKLATLDKLLEKLKAEGHRCLIYFQMTRMIDLMEEYIAYKQYKYLRLDGSSKISDRRDMVQDWQTRPEIFIFLLSTRAGGLGINLTAADTVIFYDSDWNPTVDQQAMDRAHRLGQTKQVTVYRLITKGTIEERILQRAKQKDEIQKVVISGGEFKQVDFKPREIVSLLLDDEELDSQLQMQLKRKADEQEEKGKATRSNKRAKKMTSESTMERLLSGGTDTLPEDEAAAGGRSSKASSSSSSKKKGRIGRPRTNISFTG